MYLDHEGNRNGDISPAPFFESRVFIENRLSPVRRCAGLKSTRGFPSPHAPSSKEPDTPTPVTSTRTQ